MSQWAGYSGLLWTRLTNMSMKSDCNGFWRGLYLILIVWLSPPQDLMRGIEQALQCWFLVSTQFGIWQGILLGCSGTTPLHKRPLYDNVPITGITLPFCVATFIVHLLFSACDACEKISGSGGILGSPLMRWAAPSARISSFHILIKLMAIIGKFLTCLLALTSIFVPTFVEAWTLFSAGLFRSMWWYLRMGAVSLVWVGIIQRYCVAGLGGEWQI